MFHLRRSPHSCIRLEVRPLCQCPDRHCRGCSLPEVSGKPPRASTGQAPGSTGSPGCNEWTCAVVYALTNAATDGFVSVQTILPLGLSVVVLAGFVAIEYRSQSPLMPLAFLRRGTVFTANVLALLLTASAGGVVFILTTFLHQFSCYSALVAGL